MTEVEEKEPPMRPDGGPTNTALRSLVIGSLVWPLLGSSAGFYSVIGTGLIETDKKVGVVSSNPLVGHIGRFEVGMDKDTDPMLIKQVIPLSL